MMNATKFRKIGLLQEVNRLFLHPMGLALTVVVDSTGKEYFGNVQDHQDDPEGMYFDEKILSAAKARRVTKMFYKKSRVRQKKLGWHVQPIPEKKK